MGGIPTDLRVLQGLCDTIAGDVLASGARTLPAIRKAAGASLASLRPDLTCVVTVNHDDGLFEIDIRERRAVR